MHILLLILKIIGIALLGILGILLVLVLLLLFVPFFYRAEGSFYENKPYAMVRIRYLFPLLQVFVKYYDENLEGKVKVFGLTVYDFFSQKEETAEKTDTEKKAKVKKKRTVDPTAKKPEENKPVVTNIEEFEQKNSSLLVSEEKSAETSEDEKQSLIEKTRCFIRTLKEKIVAFLQKLKEIREKGIEIKDKVSYYYEIWQRKETQRAFQTAKSTLFKLWKSIRPRKGLVKFHFGTGDPGSTGQMCGYLGMLYPFVGKYVMIEPDFENKIYEGDFYFRGHITLVVFLRVAWVVLFDKDIKTLRKIFMNS